MDQNKVAVRQYGDAFNRGDFDALQSLFTADAVIQGVLKKGQMDQIKCLFGP